MINEINHSIFGNIKYDYGWINDKEIYCFGKNRTIQIVVEADEDVEFESSQEDAYKSFFTNVDILLAKAEEAVYEYYQKVCLDNRERLSDDLKNKIAPLVKF